MFQCAAAPDGKAREEEAGHRGTGCSKRAGQGPLLPVRMSWSVSQAADCSINGLIQENLPEVTK